MPISSRHMVRVSKSQERRLDLDQAWARLCGRLTCPCGKYSFSSSVFSKEKARISSVIKKTSLKIRLSWRILYLGFEFSFHSQLIAFTKAREPNLLYYFTHNCGSVRRKKEFRPFPWTLVSNQTNTDGI